jgi:hypothetical protein
VRGTSRAILNADHFNVRQLMFLARRHKLTRILPVAGAGFAVALSSAAWPFVRTTHFDRLAPHLIALDRIVLVVASLCWGLSVVSWFWVADASWLMRTSFFFIALVLWLGIAIALGLTMGLLYSVWTGI